MRDIIDSWHLPGEEEERWHMAASQFRLPYWDWAQKQEYRGDFALPQVCTLDSVNIVVPGGQKTIFNPLVKFTNPKTVNGKSVPMGDPAMGENAIKDDTDVPAGWEPLPVSVPQPFTSKVLTPVSGPSA